MDGPTQHRFLNGLDDIGLTLAHAGEIDAYEARRPAWLR
jgi:3-isopropylmalate/(R)-2-methylmalate dehydratase small subunit